MQNTGFNPQHHKANKTLHTILPAIQEIVYPFYRWGESLPKRALSMYSLCARLHDLESTVKQLPQHHPASKLPSNQHLSDSKVQGHPVPFQTPRVEKKALRSCGRNSEALKLAPQARNSSCWTCKILRPGPGLLEVEPSPQVIPKPSR